MKLDIDVLIFDIDGVLVDVSESYRSAIRQTVQLYLQDILGLPPFAGDLVSAEDVAAFKLAGGFNNDWDLTTAMLRYFVDALDTKRASVEGLARHKDIPSFARAVAQAGGGLAAVDKVLEKRSNPLPDVSQDRLDTALVKRLFEELYLGEEYFQKEYGQAPLIHHGPGLIRNERRIVSLAALSTLAQKLPLGIATGRPRRQAEFALETAGMTPYFRAQVAHEDIVQAEERAEGTVRFGKPHPFALLEAVRRIMATSVTPQRGAYIGDTLDDVRAANGAKAEMDFFSIGCLAPAEDQPAMRREFERVGADVIVNHPDELVELIE